VNNFSDILQKALEAKSLVDLIVAIAQDLNDSYPPVIPTPVVKPKPKPIPPPVPETEEVEEVEEPEPEEEEEEEVEPEEPKTEEPKPEPKKSSTEDILYFPVGNTSTIDTVYLHPSIQDALTKGLKICKQKGYDVIVCETYRTPQRQEKLYAQGRTEPGSIVTQAKAYQSFHNYGLAVDLMLRDGSTITDSIASIFENLGFEWGGRWKSFKDYPHFQMSSGRTIEQIQDLYQEGGMDLVWKIT